MQYYFNSIGKHRCAVVSSSHHRHGQDRLVCLVLSVVWTELTTSQDCFQSSSIYWRLNSFVQSCLQCERNFKQFLVANWKLGRHKIKLCSRRISRQDKTASRFSVTNMFDLLPILFTPATRTRKGGPNPRSNPLGQKPPLRQWWDWTPLGWNSPSSDRRRRFAYVCSTSLFFYIYLFLCTST